MFINKFLTKFQNSKLGNLLSDSLVFDYADKISFVLLILTIVSTAFMPSGVIGLLAVCFCLSCLFKVLSKKNETAELSFLNKILIIYLLIVIISAFGASYFMLSLKGIIKTFIYIAFYFSAVYFLSTNKKRIMPVILTIAGIISIEAIIGILQNISHVEAIATWQDASGLKDPTAAISRAYGTLKPYNPNLLAGWLISGLSSIVALFSFSYIRKNLKGAILFSILFLITCYSIFVTGSRGAYLGLFGILAVIFIYAIKYFGGLKQIKTKYKAILAGAMALFIGGVCLIPSFSQRILSIFAFRKDSSISFRMNVYEACYQMFLDNKFLGIGVGNKNFREIYGLYMKTGYDALGSYCVPLEIAVESGIFALIFFMLFIILIVMRCIRFISLKNIHPVKKILILSVLLTITGTMMHGLFDTIFFRPQVQILFWTNIAIFHALTIKREKLKKLRLLK